MPDTDTIYKGEPNKGRRTVMLVYVLQFIGLISAGIAGIIAVVIAHIKSGTVDAAYQTHLSYQMRTFWYGLAMGIVGGLLTIVLVGWLIILFWWIWTLIRIIKGFLAVNDDRPIDNPTTAMW